MMRIKGFLMTESLIALLISFLAVSTFYLLISEGQKNGRELELKVDEIYAECVLKKSKVDKIIVHDRIYRRKAINND